MGFWLTLFMWVAGFALQDYFRAKLPRQDPSGEGDFQSPTATEGRKVPQVVGGTVKVKGPNTLWYGDWEAVPVTVETGVIFKRDETVGYQYNVAIALGQFQGQCAGMTAIYIGDDKVWDYVDDNGGNVSLLVDIDLPDLFGGEKSGGGFVGRVRAFNGDPSQSVSTFLQSRIPLQSRWPGFTYVVITNTAEDGGANIGESNALRDIRIEWQAFETIANGGLGNDLSLTGDQHIIGRDANPISAAYRVLTDPDWSIAAGDINFSNFATAAATVSAEGIGYSQLVDNEIEAWEVLAEIEKHIDGYIGPNPQNGLIEIILARNDYVAASEYQADETNIVAINDYSKPEWPQTKNEVKVRFVNREKDYKDDHAVAQDMAGRLIAGRPQSITLRFPGLRDATAANAIVARTSRTYFWPLAKFELELDRTAWQIRPGDVLIVTHPDIEAVDLPCRATRVRIGDPLQQTIKIDVVQDVFRTELGTQSAPPSTEHVPPTANPVPFGTSSPIEFINIDTPRWMLRVLGVEEEARPFLAFERISPNLSWDLNYRSRGNPFSGNFSPTSGWYSGGNVNTFATKGYLRDAIPQLQATINDGRTSTANGGGMVVDGNLSSIIGTYTPRDTSNPTGFAVISPNTDQEEWVGFETVIANGGGIECQNMIRAIGHKAQKEHVAGEPVYFIITNASGPYLMENIRPDQTDDGYSMQIQIATNAAGGSTSFVTSSEFAIRYDLIKNYPDAPVKIQLVDPFGNTFGGTWFPDGVLIEADRITATNNPSISGFNIQGRYRRTDVLNPGFAANGLRDDGSSGTNMNADMNPTLHWWIYNLDNTPNPTQGTDAVMSGTQIGADDLDNNAFIALADIHAAIDGGANIPAHGQFNARFELAYSNQGSPQVDGVTTGFLSDFVRCDNILDYTHSPTNPAARFYTLLLLHFASVTDGQTTTEDSSLYYAPVTMSGNTQIRANTSPQSPLPSPELPPGIVGSGFLEIVPTPGSPIPSPGSWVEVADVSPLQFQMNSSDPGFTVQFKVWFTQAPGASTGEYPLVTKWRESDNERQFWVGMVNNTLTLRWSLNGTSFISNSDVARTWNAGQWYDVVIDVTNEAQWSSQNRIFYWRDGAFLGIDFPSVGTWGGDLHNSAAPLRIGADGDGQQCPATVYLDEVRILETKPYRIPFTPVTDPFPGNEYETPLLLTFANAADAEDTTLSSDDGNAWTIDFPTQEVVSPRTKIVVKSPFTESPETSSPAGKSLFVAGNKSSSGENFNSGISFVESQGTASGGRLFDFGTNAFSWEMFVNFNAIPSSKTGSGFLEQAMIGSYHRTGVAPWWDFWWVWRTDDGMQFAYQNAANVTEMSVTAYPSPGITTGVWYHCAVCRDESGAFAMFHDGQRIYYDASAHASVNLLHHDSARISVGRFWAPSTSGAGQRYRPFDGYITNVRMLNGITAYDPNQTTLTIPTDYF